MGDPSYPLYPIFNILASAMLLVLFLTSIFRQSWNLGVAMLCFWLSLEDMIQGVNSVVWSDNAEIKAYVYCDIFTHVQFICTIVRPMASLIITRRLNLIVSAKAEVLTQKLSRWDAVLEWFLGLGIPLIVAGPFYYIVQTNRFLVIESVGCINTSAGSVLTFLLTSSWGIIIPIISITVYYPRVLRTFYLHYKDASKFARSHIAVSRSSYLRVLAIASIDILFNLPTNIVSLSLDISESLTAGPIPFYPGWSAVHSNWGPSSLSYADLEAGGDVSIGQLYVSRWTPCVLSLLIFAILGTTDDVRASYLHIIRTVGGYLGRNTTQKSLRDSRSVLETMEFGPAQESMIDVEKTTKTVSLSMEALEGETQCGTTHTTSTV